MEHACDIEVHEPQQFSKERQVHQQTVDQLQRACRDARSLKIISHTDESVLEAVVRGVKTCKTGRLVNTFSVEFLCDVSGTSRSTFHRAIKRLETAGLIYMTTGSTGWRGKTDGYLAGIDASPLMERAEEMRAQRKQQIADAVEESKLRERLRSLKGQLRRCIERLGDGTAEFLDGTKLFASIPLRFGNLTVDELRKLRDTILQFLTLIFGEPESVSSPEMGHETDQATPPTKDSNKDSICKKDSKSSLSENRGRAPAAPQNISLEWVIRMLTPAEKETFGAFRTQTAKESWAVVCDIARVRYVDHGGDSDTANSILRQLGERYGTALLLLVSAKAQSGGVRNVIGYSVSCMRKAISGDFDWKSALNRKPLNTAL